MTDETENKAGLTAGISGWERAGLSPCLACTTRGKLIDSQTILCNWDS